REPESIADLPQRLRLGAVETEAQRDYGVLALTKQRQGPSKRLVAERVVHYLLRQRPIPGDHVSKEGVVRRDERLIEAGRGAGRHLQLERLREREACSFGHLLQRRLP